MEEGKELYTTYDGRVLSSSTATNLSHLEPCDHEEADRRTMVHVCDACLSGHRRILIRINDPDVVVMAITMTHTLPVDELWIAYMYGTGKHLRYIAAHSITLKIGRETAQALPMFYSITGCGIVSFFCREGQKNCMGSLERVP